MAVDFTLSYLLMQFFSGFSGSKSPVKRLLSCSSGLRLLCSNPASYSANRIAKTRQSYVIPWVAEILKEPKASSWHTKNESFSRWNLCKEKRFCHSRDSRFLLGHWNSGGMGCQLGMSVPAVRAVTWLGLWCHWLPGCDGTVGCIPTRMGKDKMIFKHTFDGDMLVSLGGYIYIYI